MFPKIMNFLAKMSEFFYFFMLFYGIGNSGKSTQV